MDNDSNSGLGRHLEEVKGGKRCFENAFENVSIKRWSYTKYLKKS
jgi:hypothetical protein